VSRRKGNKPARPQQQPRTYRVELDRKHALEPIGAIHDAAFKGRVFAAIRAHAEDPRPRGCKKLSGTRTTFWRVRVSDWCVVYTIDDTRVYVLVVRAGDRNEVYGLLADALT